MGRLTYENQYGEWWVKGIQREELHEGKTISKDMQWALYGALGKLKDYEDTGFEPAEVERLVSGSDKVDTYEALKVAVTALETQLAVKQNGWIPAKERVPKDSDEIVLVQATGQIRKNILLEDALILAQYYKGEWFLEQYPMADVDVVAWQPLPEPYKAEKE